MTNATPPISDADNVLQIVRTDSGYHVFDRRAGQTMSRLVSRDHPSRDSAVTWCCANYGVSPEHFREGPLL